MKLTSELLKLLIETPKEIIQPPGKPKLDRGHYRIGFEMQSPDQKYFFSGFGRYNAMFEENFSVGLIFIPKDEKGMLEILRCNGPHGEHKMFPHHNYYHIHKATSETIDQGLKEDSFIELTDKFTTFGDALRFFVRYVHLKPDDIVKFFPDKDSQLEMF
jgi:hypothetical protein